MMPSISAVPVDVVRSALPAGIACVQNAYSLLDRSQEETLELRRAEGIAWVPYFPLGSAFPGFPNVADDSVVSDVAGEIGATPAQVGLAWLLAHSPNTLLIPGTRSLATWNRTSPRAISRCQRMWSHASTPWAAGSRGGTVWSRPSTIDAAAGQ
jgi:aryl-alcohol dehydrogenase-like predicted oxidoreductase